MHQLYRCGCGTNPNCTHPELIIETPQNQTITPFVTICCTEILETICEAKKWVKERRLFIYECKRKNAKNELPAMDTIVTYVETLIFLLENNAWNSISEREELVILLRNRIDTYFN
jgi:hypothetical protein